MTSDADIVIREARPDDLAAVAATFLACWRTSYAGFLPPDVIAVYDPASARELWRRTLARPAADATVFVAERGGRDVLGVIRIGPDPDEPASGHVFSLYVHPDAQGLGLGTLLLDAAVARFRGDGLPDATLWVFAANAAARGFYARQGWHADGAGRIEPQYREPELRLRRSVLEHTDEDTAGAD
jgi:ribosomal protein S18 acetylase RimI-like enzyme